MDGAPDVTGAVASFRQRDFATFTVRRHMAFLELDQSGLLFFCNCELRRQGTVREKLAGIADK
jgi:hypothetical protein